MNFDLNLVLIALRNNLVSFHTQLVELHGTRMMMGANREYSVALDLLDPDFPNHLDTLDNAITQYRMAVCYLDMQVIENNPAGELTPNQLILKKMKTSRVEWGADHREYNEKLCAGCGMVQLCEGSCTIRDGRIQIGG